MGDKCICETGGERHVDSDWAELAATEISVSNEFGEWRVTVSHPDNYGPSSYGPVFFCPLCGRKL